MTPYDNFESTSVEVAALLAAIQQNPKDDTARLVLADWLQEHVVGSEELQNLYRGGARKWLEEFCADEKECTNYSEVCASSFRCYQDARDGIPNTREPVFEEHIPITYDMLIKAGHEFLDSEGDDYFTQHGNEGLRNKMSNAATRTMFWRCFEIQSGRIVEPEPAWAEYGMNPFSCSC